MTGVQTCALPISPGSKKQNLQEIKDYLDTHYTEKITLDALAERFYINKFYLTRVFKEQFGQSVTNYLVQLRITQSKRLLRFTDRSIEAVAQECGLNDANYFSRLFKKVDRKSTRLNSSHSSQSRMPYH